MRDTGGKGKKFSISIGLIEFEATKRLLKALGEIADVRTRKRLKDMADVQIHNRLSVRFLSFTAAAFFLSAKTVRSGAAFLEAVGPSPVLLLVLQTDSS